MLFYFSLVVFFFTASFHDGAIPSVLVAENRNLQTVQIKNEEIGICYFSTNHTALSIESKDWLSIKLDNMSFSILLIISESTQ